MDREWFKSSLKALGKTQKDLASFVGVDPSAISLLLKGQRKVKSGELVKLANFFNVSIREVAWKAGLLNREGKPEVDDDIELSYAARVNVYCSSYGIADDDSRRFSLPWDSRYPGALRFAIELQDKSANLFFPKGAILFCIPLHDIGRRLRSGDLVVCKREKEGEDGQVFEITVRQFKFENRQKSWFFCPTNDPELMDTRKVLSIVSRNEEVFSGFSLQKMYATLISDSEAEEEIAELVGIVSASYQLEGVDESQAPGEL